jgi:uncharacterized protein (UPF0248 family)
MSPVPLREYRMTIVSRSYHKALEGVKSHELHFRVSRKGSVKTVRRILATRGIQYFQGFVYRRTGESIPLHRIEVRFERELPATRQTKHVRVEARSIIYKGRHSQATTLGQGKLSYPQERRRKITRRRRKVVKRSEKKGSRHPSA